MVEREGELMNCNCLEIDKHLTNCMEQQMVQLVLVENAILCTGCGMRSLVLAC